MDPYAEAGMIFTLIMAVLIGGFIITYPIMRRLGGLMEESIRERRAARLDQGQVGDLEKTIGDVHGALEQLDGRMALLAERQDFVENLLSHRDPSQLPKGQDWR